jgi:hypothetical protein
MVPALLSATPWAGQAMMSPFSRRTCCHVSLGTHVSSVTHLQHLQYTFKSIT